MQVAQDAPKLLSNFLAICVEDMITWEKCEKEWKHFKQGNKSSKSNAAFLLKSPF